MKLKMDGEMSEALKTFLKDNNVDYEISEPLKLFLATTNLGQLYSGVHINYDKVNNNLIIYNCDDEVEIYQIKLVVSNIKVILEHFNHYLIPLTLKRVAFHTGEQALLSRSDFTLSEDVYYSAFIFGLILLDLYQHVPHVLEH